MKEKITLTKEKETLLATLYARATESKSSNPIIKDEMAEHAIDNIDYDFRKLKVDVLSIAMRAKQFDIWTNEFLSQNPKSIVIQLGCGLDSRIYRINPSSDVYWYDIDFPEVIDLRKKIYPTRSGYEMIGSSLENLDWISSLPNNIPVWIIAEGVTMYLSHEIMEPLLKRFTEYFQNGAIAFDAISKSALGLANKNRSIKATGATFGGWYVDNPDDLKKVAPKLNLVSESVTHRLPGYSKLPIGTKILVRIFDYFPSLRRMSRILYLKF